MPEIAPGVTFDVVAREIRCKWSGEDEKASLVALQGVLNKHSAALKSVSGVTSVKRVSFFIFLFFLSFGKIWLI